jgi:O-antigen ligase/tetratricopeptide (TPR) repeat protein
MKGSSFSSAPLAGVFSLLIAVAAAWLAVASQPWAQTLLIAAVALLYLASPPSGHLPRPVLFLFGAAMLLALTAFLPLGSWEESIRRPFLDQGIALPVTLSAQPWLSLEDAVLLFTSLLWAWNCFEAKFSLAQRKFLLAAFLASAVAVAVSSLTRDTPLAPALPDWSQQIGQFPNRNQTGDLLMMAGIGCFARALSDLLNRKKRGLIWMALTGLFTAAIIENGSRGAAVLLGLGLLLLFGFTGKLRRHGLTSWFVVAVVIVAALCLFYYEGSIILSRFRDLLGNTQGGRLQIYQDTLLMISRSPWWGVGLGNFMGFFNVHRPFTGKDDWYALHPESDWLWLGAEMGVGGLLVFALLVFFAFRIYLGKSPFPVLTHASLTIAIAFLLHSLFDVGGHRTGAVWTCLFLVGLGAFRPNSTPVYRVPRFLLRLAGLFLLAVALLRVQSMSTQPWMPTRGSQAEIESLVPDEPSAPEQKALLDRALGWAPLEWRLYYQRGVVAERTNQFSAAADDFRRCLFLDPSTSTLPLSIADVCRLNNLPAALQAWREALRRCRGAARDPVYQHIFENPDLDERTRLQLATLAGDDPELGMIAVVNQYPADFDWSRENFLASNPSLHGVTPALAQRFFNLWAQAGDAAQLADEWPEHPEWAAAGWRAHAQALARIGLFDAAVRAALEGLPPPRLPNAKPVSLQDAQQAALLQPQDSLTGIQLYLAQSAAGQSDAALKTLQGVDQLPDAPPYVAYLLARDLLAAGQNQAAWNAVEPLLSNP